MAEEPQPEDPPPSGSTEDRKAAAALSNLEVSNEDSSKTSGADAAALNNAVSNLSFSDAKTAASKQEPSAATKKVKIDQADVAFMVEELEVSKTKATEMLKAHGGNRMEAVRTFITPVS